MNHIFKDENKTKLYSDIQTKLFDLTPNSDDDNIEEIFQLLPPTFYDEKENLIMICQFFGMIGRYKRKMGRIVIKLFERILTFIKRDLQNESSIIWNFFGGCFYYKLWMYKEGLIDIKHIILCAQSDKSSKTAEYFLPEIIENDFELYEKEIKFKSSNLTYSKESTKKLKLLRDKHFKWLKESNDFNDPFYREIETDQLRLSIKTDDIFSFQKVIYQTNLSVNSIIHESLIENYLRVQIDIHLIDYSINYEAFNIFKFLILNGAELNLNVMNNAIQSGNYDVIHLIESKMSDQFEKYAICYAVGSWNQEIIEYIIENYDFEFLKSDESETENQNDTENQNNNNILINIKDQNGGDDIAINNKNSNQNEYNSQNEIKNIINDDQNNNDENIIENIESDIVDRDDLLMKIINNVIYNYNFIFFKSNLLPFLRKHPIFVKTHINEIIMKSFEDMSFYLSKEFLQYPGIDINYTSSDQRKSFLNVAIEYNNSSAVKHLLENPEIDVNGHAYYSPLFCACAYFKDLKIVDMLSHHPKVNVNFREPQFNDSVFQISLIRGNVYALKYLIENFTSIEINNVCNDALFCVNFNHLMSLKVFIQYLMSVYDAIFEEVIDECLKFFKQFGEDDDKSKIFLNIVNELKPKKNLE